MKKNNFTLIPGKLTLEDFKDLLSTNKSIVLSEKAISPIQAAAKFVETIIEQDKTVYGINTGFGLLAHTKIKSNDLKTLQKSLILSHAAGVGPSLQPEIIKLILLLKINSLALGYSGVRLETINALIALYNAEVYPFIPEKGSVGASGDLAPLAHLSLVLIGEGHIIHQKKILSAREGLKIAKLKPLTLGPKEGLALLNGTQVSTALTLFATIEFEKLFFSAMLTGAMTTEAIMGSHTPFDKRIHAIRGLVGQQFVAEIYRKILKNSELNKSHKNCDKVQDPYSIRCQPQVMGACFDQFSITMQTCIQEANGVSDNPLVFAKDKVILSGGNFHAEPIAMVADNLALAIAEVGSLSERRIALLVDPHFSGLPAFLVKEPGLNSGFMIPQVTAAALVSENKSLAHPASVDSIPTSANQEDHVSMATFAGRRLLTMLQNIQNVIAIELLASGQGIDFRRPLKTSPAIEEAHQLLREMVPFYEKDRSFMEDITIASHIVQSGYLEEIIYEFGF